MNQQRSSLKAFVIGLLIAYFVFVIRPVITTPSQAANLNLIGFPTINPIGVDLRQMMSYANAWAVEHHSPYVGLNLYPPLTTVLFAPLLLVRATTIFNLMTIASLAAAFWLFWWMPRRWVKSAAGKAIWYCLTGVTLLSYGFFFEIERGQFNLIATALSICGVYLFHFADKRWRAAAYLLFSIGVQLKVYPFIFILLLTKNWSDWRDNIKRFLLLSAVNFAALFILGWSVFKDFLAAIADQSADPFVWIGNHSIKAFTFNTLQTPDFELYGGFIAKHTTGVQLTLFAILGVSLLLSLWFSIRRRRSGFDPYLLTNITAGMLLIPAVSHDYKLPLLALPVILMLNAAVEMRLTGRQHVGRLVAIGATSFLFISLSVSYLMKDPVRASVFGSFFQNNLVAVLLIALIATYLSSIEFKQTDPS